MVTGTRTTMWCAALVAQAAAKAAKSPKLPPSISAAAFMAIVGILLVGMFLIAIVLLGGNWARRQHKQRPGPSVPPDRLPAISKKSQAGVDQADDDASLTGETMVDGSRGDGDTRPN